MLKHFISIDDLSTTEIQKLFHRTASLKNPYSEYYSRILEGSSYLKNKILANLFYEPSTRTSSSFNAAMLKLGGRVISINEINYSSVSKGENLEDTIRTIGCYSDIIVLRSQIAGEAKLAAEVSTVPIINAGDGIGEHPTQTLLDLYTIWEKFGKIDGLTITMMGDLKNGRTIHSLLHSLKHYNVKINLISPDNLTAPFRYANGVNISLSLILTQNICQQTDVLYMTRVQKERGSIGQYELTKDNVDNFKENMIVMHPFPRNEEIPKWFDTDPRAYYFKQIENGLYVRMALLMSYK